MGKQGFYIRKKRMFTVEGDCDCDGKPIEFK